MNPSTLYAALATDDAPRIYKSVDGGGSWNLLVTHINTYVRITALVIDPKTPSTLYLCARNSVYPHDTQGVYKSADGGGSWSPTFNNGAVLSLSSPKIGRDDP